MSKPNRERPRKSKVKDSKIKARTKKLEEKSEFQEPEVNSRMSKHAQKSKKAAQGKAISVLKVLTIIALIFGVCGLTYAAKLMAEFNGTVNNAYRPRLGGKNVEAKDQVDPLKEPTAILIMGIDDNADRQLGSSRTDSMILVTINPTSNDINMVSIPRDTYVNIKTSKFEGYDKINSAYTRGKEVDDERGGEEAAIQAVESLMNVPINYYVTVDFNALVSVVDALGGIEVDVPWDINEHYASEANNGKLLIPKGPQTLNGEQALIFSRIRKLDNDIERGNRQLIVIQEIVEKALQLGSVSKYSSVLKAIDGHFWTNMSMSTILSIGQAGLNNNFQFHSYTFDWTDGGTGSYVGIYEDSLEYISHRMRVCLGLDQKDKRDAKGYKFKSDQANISPRTPINSVETNTDTGNSGYWTAEDDETESYAGGQEYYNNNQQQQYSPNNYETQPSYSQPDTGYSSAGGGTANESAMPDTSNAAGENDGGDELQ